VTKALIAHRATRKVEIIGNAKVGSIIAQECGKYLKPVLMEMGDKAAAVVLEDASIEEAARTCIFGGKNTLISWNDADYASIYASWPDLLWH
jgi:acyl-CoA reductase-like NAD-dependent aldehyde dehydrogenase